MLILKLLLYTFTCVSIDVVTYSLIHLFTSVLTCFTLKVDFKPSSTNGVSFVVHLVVSYHGDSNICVLFILHVDNIACLVKGAMLSNQKNGVYYIAPQTY